MSGKFHQLEVIAGVTCKTSVKKLRASDDPDQLSPISLSIDVDVDGTSAAC